jgi:hypothetical protein
LVRFDCPQITETIEAVYTGRFAKQGPPGDQGQDLPSLQVLIGCEADVLDEGVLTLDYGLGA